MQGTLGAIAKHEGETKGEVTFGIFGGDFWGERP
jgi:hypothetical protein